MESILHEAERCMVIMAHPDDAEIQCGGTVARLIAAGKEVVYVLCTRGNRGMAEPSWSAEQLATWREAEQRAAAAVLGVKEIVFLGYDDGDLAFHRPHLRQDIVALIRRHRPDVIFTHDPFAGMGSYEVCYLHPDHRAVGETVLEAAFFCAPGPLFYPEQLSDGLSPHRVQALCLAMSDRPDLFVDIGATFQTKIAAIAKHDSQWSRQPDLEGFFHRMAQAAGEKSNLPLAEVFKLVRA